MLLCFNYGWHIGPRASLFLHIHVRLGKIVHKGILQIFIRTLYGQVILGQHLQGYAWSSRIFWGNMGAFVSMELWECCLKACQQNVSLICVVNKSSWVELTNSKTWEEDQNTREKEKEKEESNSLKGEIQLWLDWRWGSLRVLPHFGTTQNQGIWLLLWCAPCGGFFFFFHEMTRGVLVGNKGLIYLQLIWYRTTELYNNDKKN